MSINDVPVLPFRASRHLTAWIVWQTVRVSLVEDAPISVPAKPRKRSARSRRRGA